VTIVVDRKPKVIYPVGLCVDTDRQRLYWYDAEYRTILTSKYDGSDVISYRFPAGHYISVVNLEVYMVSSRTGRSYRTE